MKALPFRILVLICSLATLLSVTAQSNAQTNGGARKPSVDSVQITCTHYVAPTGSDSHAGTSAQPWASFQHAANTAQPGDTVCFQGGTYTSEDIHLSRSGTASSPITFIASPGEAPVVDGGGSAGELLVLDKGVSHLRLSGFGLRNFRIWGIYLVGENHHVQMDHLEIEAGETSIRFTCCNSEQPAEDGPVEYITLEDSVIHGSDYSAVDCTPGPCNHMVVRRLEIYDTGLAGGDSFGSDGLEFARGYPVLVEDCYIHDNGGDGIDLNSRDRAGNATGVIVRRNRVVRNHRNGIKLWAGGRMENNVVWGQGDSAVWTGTFTSTLEVANNTIAYNMWDPAYSGRNWSFVAGYPEEIASPPVNLSLFNNIFAFNADPLPGGATGIYLGPGVNLVREEHNLYHSRAEGEITAEFVSGHDVDFTRAEIAGGTWASFSGQGQSDLTIDPRVVAVWPNVDLHLQGNSPAVDAGVLTGAPTDDAEGRARDATPDLGAYEVGATKQAQTITFATLDPKTVGDVPFSIAGKASASSGLPVSFSASGVCSVNSATVTLSGQTGTCTITAHQAGDETYSAAADVARSFSVSEASTAKQDQTITFGALESKTVGDAPFGVAGKASASSGLPVSFSASGVCTVDGTTVTLSGQTGTCTITAHQAGNETYNSAPDVARSFDVLSQSSGVYLPIVGRSAPPASTTRCTTAQPPLVTDLAVRQPPPLPEPAARTPYRDPVFGTCMVRVTDRTSDIAAGDNSAGMKNEYSRVQSFNADESRILVRGIEATWYLYDAQSLQPGGILAFDGSVDPRWDASDPNLLYFTDEARLISYNVQSGAQTVVHDFAADFPGQSLAAVWTRYEGSPSRDGRYWGLMAQNDPAYETVAFLVYDLQTNQVIAKRSLPGQPSIDSVTISPLGTYFLAYYDEYCQDGQLGTDSNPCGLMVYDQNLTNGRGLLRIVGHSDVALDAQGREVLIYQDIDTDHISMLDLASGTLTPLWLIDFSHTAIGFHFSGRAFNRPGWALISTYNGGYPTSHTWMDDQVFAVELKANGRVVRLAHTRSRYDDSVEQDYWAEPQASVNRDFTHVVFTTNWGRSGTEAVEMFMAELPPDWWK